MCNLLAVDGVHDPGVASINAGKIVRSTVVAWYCESYPLAVESVTRNNFSRRRKSFQATRSLRVFSKSLIGCCNLLSCVCVLQVMLPQKTSPFSSGNVFAGIPV